LGKEEKEEEKRPPDGDGEERHGDGGQPAELSPAQHTARHTPFSLSLLSPVSSLSPQVFARVAK